MLLRCSCYIPRNPYSAGSRLSLCAFSSPRSSQGYTFRKNKSELIITRIWGWSPGLDLNWILRSQISGFFHMWLPITHASYFPLFQCSCSVHRLIMQPFCSFHTVFVLFLRTLIMSSCRTLAALSKCTFHLCTFTTLFLQSECMRHHKQPRQAYITTLLHTQRSVAALSELSYCTLTDYHCTLLSAHCTLTVYFQFCLRSGTIIPWL